MVRKSDFQRISDIAPFFAARKPDAVALHFEGRDTTWAAFEHQSNQIANALLAEGLKPGDCIGYIGKNSDDWFKLFFGACKMGGILVPTNWRLSAPEIGHIARDAGMKMLFVAGEDFASTARKVAAMTPDISRLVSIEATQNDWPEFTDWYGGFSDKPPKPTTGRRDIAFLMYTSGTTGKPKGVMISHDSFLKIREIREAVTKNDVLLENDVSLIALPLGHIGGMAYGCKTLYAGGQCVITREMQMDLLLDVIENHSITNLPIVPTALQILLQHPRVHDIDFSGLRLMAYGTSPMPLELLKTGMKVFGCEFAQSYGLTESLGTQVQLPPEMHDPKGTPQMRSTGCALPGAQIKIIDPDGTECTTGQIGQILLHGPGNMLGYWNNPVATAEAIDADNWLHTGDAGYLDGDGYLFICDRLKDMIISGGENIYSTEVENAISSHPDVEEVAVIGVPDDKWGESVKAFVILRAGATLTQGDIIAWAKRDIAGFKAPKIVQFTKDIPRNATGKISKAKLREISF